MLDQSFSAANFQIILSKENRKGRNLEKEFFPSAFEITQALTLVNKKIQHRFRLRIEDDLTLFSLKEEKANKKTLKNELIENAFTQISQQLQNPQFKITISKIETDDKPVYTIAKTAENYFAIKQLQFNVRKSFDVKQANRFAIVNQVNSLLSDNFPKVVLRTDVKSFYESIPHDKLLKILNDNPLLSFLSKKLIWKILKDFVVLSESADKIGVPRGIGVSAFLAELYMRDIDKEIAALPDVTYYSRYVDDIIIVFTPISNQKIPTYIDNVKRILETDTGLTMNSLKTSEIELVLSNADRNLDFLGYQFEFKDLKLTKIRLTEKKLNKYKGRITTSIQEFNRQRKFDLRAARRTLIHRLNFLTGNTRLENNKANILVGIYYTNNLLSEPLEDLTELDEFLYSEIDASITDIDLRNRLKQFSFRKGFEERKFVNFDSKNKRVTLKEILETL
jgi:hypothetical protein